MNESAPARFSFPFASVVQWGAVFLLAASAVMLPLVSGTNRPLSLLVLALGGAGAFFWLLLMIFDREVVLPWAGLTVSGALVLAAGLVSGIFSDCPQAALVTLLTWVGYGAVFLMCVWVGRAEHVRRGLVRLICALALPVAVYGILQYAVLLDMARAQIEADKAATLRSLGLSEQYYDALLQRTISRRVYSTFVLPNSLAGYLLILIPPSIALAASARRRLTRSVLAACAGVMMLGLFFTFSKGGWLAGGVVLLVFLATKGWRWLRRHGWAAAGALVAAAALLIAAASVSPTLRQRLTDMTRELGATAHVRIQYWEAAIGMWRAHPVLGVGPGNFQNQYLKYAPVAAEETRNAHNDYVQLLAECGPIAAAGYLLFWLFLLLGAVRSVRSVGAKAVGLGPAPPPSPRSWLMPSAAALGILGAAFLGPSFQILPELWVHLSMVGLFLLFWWLLYSASGEVAITTPALTASLAFGLLGFALHSLVDMNLQVDGLACTVFAAAGLAAAPWVRGRTFPLSPRLQFPVLIVTSLAALGVFYATSRVSGSDSSRLQGVNVAGQGSPVALDLLKQATRLNPLDHQALAELGQYWELEFRKRKDTRDLESSLAAWKRATALNPSFADYHFHYARVFAEAAEQRWIPQDCLNEYQRKYEVLGLPAPPRGHFVPAIVEAYHATEDAPFKPQYRLFYGLMLRLGWLPGEAQKQYQIALDLHNTMVAQGAPPRQRLTDAELKTAEEGACLDRKP